MGTNKLMAWKPEGASPDSAAVLMAIALALAVFAAGMVPAGCENLTGTGAGDATVFTETTEPVPESAGGPSTAIASGLSRLKTINIKFEVYNGGWGLVESQCIISNEADDYLATCRSEFYYDYTGEISVPVSEKFLNIRWRAKDGLRRCTYLKAKMRLDEYGGDYIIVLDYNGRGNVATKNLYDVSVSARYGGSDFNNALAQARGDEMDIYGLKRYPIKFEVLNGGAGIRNSYAILSDEADTKLYWQGGILSEDFHIYRYLNPDLKEFFIVRFKIVDNLGRPTYIKGKWQKPGITTIKFDYYGVNDVEITNLSDVETGKHLEHDFDEAKSKAIHQ